MAVRCGMRDWGGEGEGGSGTNAVVVEERPFETTTLYVYRLSNRYDMMMMIAVL